MAIERYHGSPARTFAYRLFVPIGKRVWSAVRRRLLSPDRQRPAEVGALLGRAEDCWSRGDLEGARAAAHRAADIMAGAPGRRRDVGGTLILLGELKRGLEFSAPALRIRDRRAREWRGEDIAGRTLVVVQKARRDMGEPIRLARFLAAAERRAGRLIVFVEARLVPLFSRSFPRAEVRPLAASGVSRVGEALVTGFATLAHDCVDDWSSIPETFVPLRPDPDAVEAFRARYRRHRRPLVGLTWGSTTIHKDVPELAAWARLVADFPGTIVSLQYGSVAAALRALRGAAADRLIEDPSVDQLADMDRFAAQIAALDAVIGISNTAIHLAGALGVPTVIVGDDKFRGAFPLAGESSGWYPSAIQVRKRGRAWPDVLAEAEARLRAMVTPS